MRKVLVTVLVMMFAVTTLYAAGVGITGFGVRATNLAGNYRALSNDWSGMYWNPAGLVWSKGLKVGASVELITPSASYAAIPYKGAAFSATSATTITSEKRSFPIPSAGIFYSNEKMAYGFAVFAPFGLGSKWDLLNTSVYNPLYPEFEYEDDLKVIAVQPTFAYKLSDKMSMGVGLMLTYADIMIRKPTFTPNPVTFDPAYAALKAQLGASAQPPFDHFLTEALLDGTGMGFGAAFGLQYKPVETLTLGVSGKWYNTISLDGTLMADTYYAKGPANVKPTLDYLLSVSAITTAQYQQLMGAYSGAKAVAIPEIDVKADMPLPITIGAGFAFTGINNLLITGDVALTTWSAWKVIEIKDTDGNLQAELEENWEDTIRLGLGLEYALPVANAKLRAGFYSEPRAAIDETMQPVVPDASRRTAASIGLGLPLGPFEIGLMYERIFADPYTVTEWYPATPPFSNMAGTYELKSSNIMVGIDYNF